MKMLRVIAIPVVALLSVAASCAPTTTKAPAWGPAEQRDQLEATCAIPKDGVRGGPLTWEAVKENLLKEWKAFGYRTIELDESGQRCAVVRKGKIEDGDADAIRAVQKYFRAAAVRQTEKNVKCEDRPWSAAFISWVMVESGASVEGLSGRGQGQFCATDGHSEYVWHMARQDRLRTIGPPAFTVYDAKSREPQVGDFICSNREKSKFGLRSYISEDGKAYSSHCDIVVAIIAGKLHAIGGNVQDGVTRTILPLKGGKLVQSGEVRNWKIVVEAKYDGSRAPLEIPKEASPDGSRGICYADRPLPPEHNCAPRPVKAYDLLSPPSIAAIDAHAR